MLDSAEKDLQETLKKLIEQVDSISKTCQADPLIGDLPAAPATHFDVQWDERRFWLLVRMTCQLDEGNRRLLLLQRRGAINKNEMKRRQLEFARPYRAALQNVVNLAAQLEVKAKADSTTGVGKS